MTESAVTPKEKQAKIDALIVVGRQMANICFNLSQGIKLAEAHRTAMKELYQEWDKALREVRNVQP